MQEGRDDVMVGWREVNGGLMRTEEEIKERKREAK